MTQRGSTRLRKVEPELQAVRTDAMRNALRNVPFDRDLRRRQSLRR